MAEQIVDNTKNPNALCNLGNNDRSAIIAIFFNSETGEARITESYYDTKRLLFGCKTSLVCSACNGENFYTSCCMAAVYDEGTDDEAIEIQAMTNGAGVTFQYLPDGTFMEYSK